MIRTIAAAAYECHKRFAHYASKATGVSRTKILRQYVQISQAAESERRDSVAETLKSFDFLSYRIHCWRAHELKFLLNEVFGRSEYRFTATNPSPRILDCGANIGVSVLFFKHLYPASSILAIEADEKCCEALSANILENRLRNVESQQRAVSGTDGPVEFFRDPTRPGSLRGSISKVRARDGILTRVDSVRLSSLLDQQQVDLLKLDVEGAETAVLRDISDNQCWNNIGEIAIEYHHNVPESGNRLSAFLSMIETAGFSFTISARAGSETPRNDFQDVMIRAKRTEA